MPDADCKIGCLGFCGLLISLGIAIPIIVCYPSLIRPYPNPGKVISENCSMSCVTDLGCTYSGTIVIAYTYDNQSDVQTVPTNEACEPDCCESLIKSGETIWLELNQTHQIVDYDVTRTTTTVLMLITAALGLLAALGIIGVAVFAVFQHLTRSCFHPRGRRNYDTIN
jgi:hypothetical protein